MEYKLIDYLVLHGVFIVGEVLIVLTLLHMLYQRRTPTSMISWLLFMIVLPYISVLLYFLIGTRKQSDDDSKSALEIRSSGGESRIAVNSIDGILRSNGIAGVSEHNSFELVTGSVAAFEMLMEEIHKAEKSISMSTYVFGHDAVTQDIVSALTEKALKGVEVRLLIDSLGSYRTYFFQGSLKKLRRAGAEVRFFMPLFRLPYQNHINLRNHRKIYLFDEQTLLSGGMNLSEEYMGPVRKDSQWEDVLFRTRGEAVYQYAQIFEDDWAYATGQPLRHPAVPGCLQQGDVQMQVVPSGPDIKGDALLEALISTIYSATERIWIVTPYFIPDECFTHALKIARHRGVDVRLITPKVSNHLLADLSRSSYMRELAESDIRLVLYKGNMLHAKAVLIDSRAAMIGSVNIDNRSLLLNYEVVSFVYSETVIEEVEKWMLGFVAKADVRLPGASRARRIAENFMRILAPQL